MTPEPVLDRTGRLRDHRSRAFERVNIAEIRLLAR
jgi:hypothetical protein